jgi:hypothetical protein
MAIIEKRPHVGRHYSEVHLLLSLFPKAIALPIFQR